MISLTPSQEEEKNLFLSDLNKNIIKISHRGLDKIRAYIKKNIKISLCKGRIIAPFLIGLGITFGGFSILGTTPFIVDKDKSYLKTKEVITSYPTLIESIKYEQYEPFETNENIITYYDTWNLDNGLYKRNVKVYRIGEIDISKIKELLKTDFNKIEDLFGEAIINRVESREYVSFTENIPYLEASIYSEDENNYIYVDQPVTKNINETIGWFVLTLFIEIMILTIRDIFPHDYEKEINEIKEYYKHYVDNLDEILRIRKNNVDRLTKYHNGNVLKYLAPHSETIFSYLDPKKNINLSTLDGEELTKVIILLDELTLRLRSDLNIDKNNTFGIEIEVERANRNKMIESILKYYKEIKDSYYFKKFIERNKNTAGQDLSILEFKYDGSLDEGVEITTSPLIDNEKTWEKLEKICELIRPWCIIGRNSSIHVHVGSHILGNNLKAWLNFCAFWSTYENIIYRFLYGNFLTGRPSIMKYARPISKELWEDYEKLKDKEDLTLKELLRIISYDKNKAINFLHVDYLSCDGYEEGNTIESRGQNTSLDAPIIQNYVNLLINIFNYCKSDKFNIDIINKRHKLISDKCYDIMWYNEIYLEQALEMCDLIFHTNIDKLYFLKQYLKYFQISQGNDYYPTSDLTGNKKILE